MEVQQHSAVGGVGPGARSLPKPEGLTHVGDAQKTAVPAATTKQTYIAVTSPRTAIIDASEATRTGNECSSQFDAQCYIERLSFKTD